MNDMPIITTKHNILDILKRPEDFIDEYSDTEIMTLPDYEAAGGILRILVGVDEDGRRAGISESRCLVQIGILPFTDPSLPSWSAEQFSK